MTFTIPYKVRIAIYITTGILTPVVLYAKARGWVGDLELTLWGAEVLFASTVAGLNASNNKEK